jgi:hypothetical protein
MEYQKPKPLCRLLTAMYGTVVIAAATFVYLPEFTDILLGENSGQGLSGVWLFLATFPVSLPIQFLLLLLNVTGLIALLALTLGGLIQGMLLFLVCRSLRRRRRLRH